MVFFGIGKRELLLLAAPDDDFVGVLAPLGKWSDVVMAIDLLGESFLPFGLGGSAAAPAPAPAPISLNSDAASELRSLIDAPRLPL